MCFSKVISLYLKYKFSEKLHHGCNTQWDCFVKLAVFDYSFLAQNNGPFNETMSNLKKNRFIQLSRQ